MRHHDAVSVSLRHLDRVERLGERADLVHLDQDRAPDSVADPALEPLRVRHENVVPHELHSGGEPTRERRPPVPVVLGQTVLQ